MPVGTASGASVNQAASSAGASARGAAEQAYTDSHGGDMQFQGSAGNVRRNRRHRKREGRRAAKKAKKQVQASHVQDMRDDANQSASDATNRATNFADTYQAAQANDDPQAKAYQQQALGQLGQWSQGTVTNADRAAQQQTQNQAEQMAQGQRDAAVQQANARGMGRSGASLQAGLMAGQNAANAGYNAASNTQQNVQQRALAATGQMGDLSSTVRGQTQQQQSSLDQFNFANQQNATSAGMAYAPYAQNAATTQQNDYNKKKNAIMAGVGGVTSGVSNAI